MQLITDRSQFVLLFLQVLLLALCYALIGRLSLLLAIPPGYATAIFPPAGIAIVSLLIWGNKLWPGVFLGSFLLNVWVSLESGSIITEQVIVALSAATGASLQSLLASKLIRYFIGFPTALSDDKDILLFLVLSGPIACVINASFGAGSLYFTGLVPLSSVSYIWFTWWVGDAIGAMITIPAILIFFGQPKPIWRSRIYAVGLPLFVMLISVISLFIWVSQWEFERNQTELNEIADINSAKLQANFDSYVDAVAAVERFFTSSTQSTITRNEFRLFVKNIIKEKPGINGLSWNPVIKAEQRKSFELSVQNEGFENFTITERNESGVLINARERTEYVAVQYIEPIKSNKNALGYDVSSSVARKKVLIKARDNAKALATAKITLVQEHGDQAGFLLFYPVYKGDSDTKEQKTNNIQGFAVGVFRIEDITDTVLEQYNRNKVVVGIYDLSDGSHTHLYGPKKHDEYGSNLYKIEKILSVGERQWQIIFWPSSSYLASKSTWQAFTALALGLLFTSLLGAFLLSMTGKSNYLNNEVNARTLEIKKHQIEIENTNNELAHRNTQLERSNKELDHYAFIASHDLKSPLQAIEQLAVWIEEDCQEVLPEPSRKHLQLLKSRIQRMKKLLADLLMFARVSREEYQSQPTNLHELIERVISFNCLPTSFNVKVKACDVILDLPVIPMELALRNLVSNAVKHHDKQKGTITIEYSIFKKEHLLTVSDDGPGIAADLQGKAVEMFNTLKPRDKVEGSGLGLSIVNKALERMNGRLKIVSDGVKGTKIELYWPI